MRKPFSSGVCIQLCPLEKREDEPNSFGNSFSCTVFQKTKVLSFFLLFSFFIIFLNDGKYVDASLFSRGTLETLAPKCQICLILLLEKLLMTHCKDKKTLTNKRRHLTRICFGLNVKFKQSVVEHFLFFFLLMYLFSA